MAHPPEGRPTSRPRPSKNIHLLSNLFEGFCAYLMVERKARPATVASYRFAFKDFLGFAQRQINAPVVISKFTTDMARAYQYEMAQRGLSSASIRTRLATLSSFGKWAVRQGELPLNPIDRLSRPSRKVKLPNTLRWAAVSELLTQCESLRDRAIIGLMAYGALRRSEVVSLDVRDFDPDFGLLKVHGKGSEEAPVPLPKPARFLVADYLATDRHGTDPGEPMFLVTYGTIARRSVKRRMTGNRVSKIIQSLGERIQIKGLHPHALRHACAVELLKRTQNLRAVQQHLRHANIDTTTIYAKLTPHDLESAVSTLDS